MGGNHFTFKHANGRTDSLLLVVRGSSLHINVVQRSGNLTCTETQCIVMAERHSVLDGVQCQTSLSNVVMQILDQVEILFAQ